MPCSSASHHLKPLLYFQDLKVVTNDVNLALPLAVNFCHVFGSTHGFNSFQTAALWRHPDVDIPPEVQDENISQIERLLFAFHLAAADISLSLAVEELRLPVIQHFRRKTETTFVSAGQETRRSKYILKGTFLRNSIRKIRQEEGRLMAL